MSTQTVSVLYLHMERGRPRVVECQGGPGGLDELEEGEGGGRAVGVGGPQEGENLGKKNWHLKKFQFIFFGVRCVMGVLLMHNSIARNLTHVLEMSIATLPECCSTRLRILT